MHKERELEDVAERYPADHYVLVDDKVWILAAIKERWGVTRDHDLATTGPLRRSTRRRLRATGRPISRSTRIGDLVGLTRDEIIEAAR